VIGVVVGGVVVGGVGFYFSSSSSASLRSEHVETRRFPRTFARSPLWCPRHCVGCAACCLVTRAQLGWPMWPPASPRHPISANDADTCAATAAGCRS
jgi:hypothetical protein